MSNSPGNTQGDNPLDALPAFNRVSIRAVLVHEGEDPSDALAEAGLVDSVAIPVVVGETPDLPGGILGNGITPNLTAVLETEQPDDPFASSSDWQSDQTNPHDGGADRPAPDPTMLPAAYGMQPLAPVRKIDG